MKRASLIILWSIILQTAFAQPGRENMPDLTPPEQAWWNLMHYSIAIRPDYATRSLTGSNAIEFRAVKRSVLCE